MFDTEKFPVGSKVRFLHWDDETTIQGIVVEINSYEVKVKADKEYHQPTKTWNNRVYTATGVTLEKLTKLEQVLD